MVHRHFILTFNILRIRIEMKSYLISIRGNPIRPAIALIEGIVVNGDSVNVLL